MKTNLDNINLDDIRESVWQRIVERIDSASNEARQELIRNIEALRGCLNAASVLAPLVENTKPDYLQVGECKAYDNSFGHGSEVELPFTEMRGYYQNQTMQLTQGATDTVRAIAQALSGRQKKKLEPGTYRYAILLYRIEENEPVQR